MKKFKYLITSLFVFWLFISQSFAYDVIIYGPNNELITMFPVEEWTTEITLEGNRSKDWNNYTFEDWFYWTDVYYTDIYWNNKSVNLTSDLYLNWSYDLNYTGEQYLNLVENSCYDFSWYVPYFEFTWTTQPTNTDYNMFNNFGDNALKVLLSNIPWYFQYFIIFSVIILIISLIKLFRKRK